MARRPLYTTPPCADAALFLGNSLGPISGGTVAAFIGIPWVFVLTTALLLLGLVWVAVAVPEERDK